MGKVVGSIRKVTIDGVSFNAAADADFKQTRGSFANEAIATSGENMRKMVKRVETTEGVDLITTPADYETLKEKADSGKDFPMSYTTADGSVYRADGWIEVESRSTADGKTGVKMFPRGTWEAFLG